MTSRLTLDQLTACGVDAAAAERLSRQVNPLLESLSARPCWQRICEEVLVPEHPLELHQLLHETVFSDWDLVRGPPPAWFPDDEAVRETNIADLMRARRLASYAELHAWSAQHRAEFWAVMIRRLGIVFQRDCDRVLDLPEGPEAPRWLPGAELNIAESCFAAPDDAPAIVYQAEGHPLAQVSYGELLSLTNRVARGLVTAGFEPGDPIAVDMPMTAESVAIYLGIVKAGCAVVGVADSFAPQEIEVRLRLAGARAVFTQDVIRRAGRDLPLFARVVEANAPRAIVLHGSETPSVELRSGDMRWEDFLAADDRFEAVPRRPDDHTNILFSSGTTGEPKAIPWTHATPIKSAADGSLHHDIQPADVVAWPTNLGWMMGPWLIYASLVNRATIALYYDAPTSRGFGRFVQDARVTMLGVVPSLVRAWKDAGCMRGLDWRAVKAFSSTGECSNPEDMLFLMSLAGYRPVIEYCGGTEIGGGHITGTRVQPAAPATFSTPALGLDFTILDANGAPADNGELFLLPPSIGLSNELLNRDHHQVYFEGTPEAPGGTGPLRRHGDQVECLGGGYYRAHGRVDDTMNLGGIKVSAAEIEQILNSVEEVRETAAIAVAPPEGGPSRLVICAVASPGVEVASLRVRLQDAIKRRLNPLFKIDDVVLVDELPRTASNKVMRRVLRDRYAGGASG